MMTLKTSFATMLGCMDGRAIEAVKQYMLAHYGIRFVDCITEAGMDAILLHGDETQLEKTKDKTLRISVGHHGSRLVIVVGHGDCAGNPVSKEEHMRMIRQGVEVVSSWSFPTDEQVEIIGLFAFEAGHKTEMWDVEIVSRR